jgi:hypothetical protein
LVYESFPGGPKVLQVALADDDGDAISMRYYVCSGDKSQRYPTLEEARAACDKTAGEAKRPGSPSGGREAPGTAVGCPGKRQPAVAHGEMSQLKQDADQEMGGSEGIPNAHPGPSAPMKPLTVSAGPFRVKKRFAGDLVDFAVCRDGDNLPEEVFDTESEAKAARERLNAPRAAGNLPLPADPRPASQPAA